MNNIKLSIIIPTYNAEQFLKILFKNLVLIMNNTIEVVFVDDKSNDSTVKKLKEFRKGRDNVVVIESTENCGPGIARNIGISNCSGEYVTFLDSDDYLDPNFYNAIKSSIDKNDDLIIFDYFEVLNNKLYKRKTVNGSGEISSIEDIIIFSTGCPWGKVYKRTIIMNNDIYFLPLLRNEDMPFTKTAISYCSSFSYIRKPLYYYVQNKNSLMHIKLRSDLSSGKKAFEYVQSKLNPIFSEKVMSALFYNDYLYGSAMTASLIMKRGEWIRFIRSIEESQPKWYSCSYLKKISRVRKICVILIKYKCYNLVRMIWKIHKRRGMILLENCE